MKRLLRKIALVSTITLAAFCGMTFTGCANSGTHRDTAAHQGNPIGLKPGSTFRTLFVGPAGGGWTKWQVIQVRDNWIQAEAED